MRWLSLPDWNQRRTLRHFEQLFWVTGGRGRLHLGAKTHSIERGSSCIATYGETYGFESDPKDPLEIITLRFRAELLGGLPLFTTIESPPIKPVAPHLLAQADHLCREFHLKPKHWQGIMAASLQSLCLCLAREYG